jgi:hypothetical protein
MLRWLDARNSSHPLAAICEQLNPKKAAFTQRRKDAKIFQSVGSAMPFT